MNADDKYELKKCYPQFPINDNQKDSVATLSRNNEVCFCMTASHSFVDVLRSFVDEDSPIELLSLCLPSSPP